MAAVAASLVAACGSSRTYETDPRALLREGKQAVDATQSVHFSITSSEVQASGTYITGGSGDAKRPDGFTGSLAVVVGGLPLNIAILSTHGTFYVKLPFSSTYAATDPAKYGFADPGHLIDPSTGLSTLLVSAKTASLGDRDRFRGEELYEVHASFPGQQVKDLLTSADPAKDVSGTVGINVDNHQVRRVVLTGPFFDAKKLSSYTLILDNYGENVSITSPPTTG